MIIIRDMKYEIFGRLSTNSDLGPRTLVRPSSLRGPPPQPRERATEAAAITPNIAQVSLHIAPPPPLSTANALREHPSPHDTSTASVTSPGVR